MLPFIFVFEREKVTNNVVLRKCSMEYNSKRNKKELVGSLIFNSAMFCGLKKEQFLQKAGFDEI